MGVYQYTLRKDFKKVDGILGKIKVARYSFAYKHSFGYSYVNDQRTVNRLSAFAVKASEAAKADGIQYAVVGDWERLDRGFYMEVRDVSHRIPPEFTEDLEYKEFPVVGYLIRLGKKFFVVDEKPPMPGKTVTV